MESPKTPTRHDLIEKAVKAKDKVVTQPTNYDEMWKAFASLSSQNHPETECKPEENQATNTTPRPDNSEEKPDTNATLGPDNTPLERASLFSGESKESDQRGVNPSSLLGTLGLSEDKRREIINKVEESREEIRNKVVEKTMATIFANAELRDSLFDLLGDEELMNTFIGMDAK